MEKLSTLQHFMAISLTTGFIAHDIYYVHKYIGFSISSLVLLAAIVWFHILVFLQQSGYAEPLDERFTNQIKKVRLIVATITTFICVTETFFHILQHNQEISIKNIATLLLSLLIVLFPEFVYAFIYALKRKSR